MNWVRPFAVGVLFAACLILVGNWRDVGGRLPAVPHLSGPLALTEAGPQNTYEPDERVNIAIYQRVRPSVVNITSTIVQYDLLFGPVPSSGQGSGFIINSKGYILTNYHVVRDARRLKVTWTPERNQSRSYPAVVVGAVPELDLAVLKIDATNLPAVTLGDSSNLQVGQRVLAIGNPFGLSGTMTRGIISSIRTVRDPGGTNIDNAIQTDAAINPGNSGGPLLNSAGQVIGIDSAIYSETGNSVGIGFAIPINVAKAVVNDVVTTGHVRRASLHVEGYPLSPDMSQQLGLPVDHGVLVLAVRPGSSAERAGIHGGQEPGYIGNTPVRFGGDIIVAVDGEPVEDPSDLARILITKHAGDTVHLTIYRGNRRLQVPVVLGEAGRAETTT